MTLLIVGGDSVDAVKRRAAAGGRGHVEHWSGRKTRDLTKSIPKGTEAIVVVLDRISHALAQRVRAEAARRGLPVFFKKRRQQIHAADRFPSDLRQWLGQQ